ncbi:MAG TPA: HPr(Ser) kinase/phosphatase [Longimicrobiales bacterium]|nr:HPr(Ser) kinase/phosphatase [Longimicrobiales bacterium]
MASTPGVPARLTVQDLLDAKTDSLRLELLTPDAPLDHALEDEDISSPGLALAGYTRRVPEGRMQVFGETEITYLHSLTEEERRTRLHDLFAFRVPAVFVTKGQEVPLGLLEAATAAGIPVLRSSLTTKDFFRRIKPYLLRALAPATTLHGSLADVYGVGLLFVGQSGVGKSECVLDRVERGHRLVADDVVRVRRMGNDVLIGQGLEMQRHHMEIRGIGIIDIGGLFGIRAIRQQKRIEVVVQLEHWDDTRHYNRTGLESDTEEVLGVEIPRVTVPLNPGKNITVISEVVAMNHLMRYAGVDAAQTFNDRLKAAMQPIREYLEEDFE